MVPGDERKDYDYLLNYRSKYPPELDIAWSDAFVGASAWLADRERARVEQAKNQAKGGTPNNSGNWKFTS